MLKTKMNQKGFAAVEAVLIVVILAIIGGTGYYVYHTNKKSNDTLNSASQVAASSPGKISKKKQSGSARQTAAPLTQQYLVIKGWGVEIPLSSGIKDAYYVFDSSGHAKLGTRSLTAMSAMCAPDKIGVSLLSRQTIATHNTNAQQSEPSWDHPVYPTKIGNYYYGITHAQAACGDTINTTASKQQAADFKLFDTAFGGVRPVQ